MPGTRGSLTFAELEDEVMTLRAQLQAMTNDRDGWRTAAEAQSEANNALNRDLRAQLQLMTSDRDHWKGEAAMWHNAYSQALNITEGC